MVQAWAFVLHAGCRGETARQWFVRNLHEPREVLPSVSREHTRNFGPRWKTWTTVLQHSESSEEAALRIRVRSRFVINPNA